MDMKMLSKLMEKKGKAELDPEYKSSKMAVLKALHDEMGKMMGNDVKGMKQVTVAAPDHQSLAEGLDKAKDIVGDDDEESEPFEGEESPEEEKAEEAQEEEHMSPEEIDTKIAELLKLKAKKLG